jgi:hypothetical protein
LLEARGPHHLVRRGILALGLVSALAGRATAQVGLTSGLAQVTLAARAPVQGSIQDVLTQPGIGLPNGGSQGSITLRMSANSGYRLVVRGTGRSEGVRIWFRSAAGEMREVTEGAAIVLVDDVHPSGIAERRVEYRVEGAGEGSDRLPVRYELEISPTL